MQNSTDDDYDGLAPPGCEIPGRIDWDIEHLIGLVQHVANGVETAFNLNTACCTIRREYSGKKARQIPEKQRDRILEALIQAQRSIVSLFPNPADKYLATKGLDAMGAFIYLAAQGEEQRATRHPHLYPDLQARLRWLENASHNIQLAKEINARAADRSSPTVAELLRLSAA